MVTMRRGNGVAGLLAAVMLVCGFAATSGVAAGAAPQWSVVPSASPPGPPLGELFAVSCSTAADCFAIGATNGGPLIEHWNGASWSVSTVPISGAGPSADLEGLSCTSSTSCFAVGASVVETLTTLSATPLALQWNGTQWSATAIPRPAGAVVAALSSVSCTSATNCIAVGASSDDPETLDQFTGTPFVERWDGSVWSAVPAPSPPGAIEAELLAVSCPNVSSCDAVGDYEAPALGGALLEHWDGTQWSIVPNAGANAAMSGRARRKISGFRHLMSRAKSRLSDGFLDTPGLEGVSCASDSSCFAVGFSFNGALTEHWDGIRWSVVDSPVPPATQGAELTSVSCATPTDCSAVGDAGSESGDSLITEISSEPLAEHWNGASWSIVGEPNDAPFDVLGDVACPTTTTCFAVGDSAFVQQWNGSAWSLSPFSSKTSQSQLDQVSCSSARNCFAVGTAQSGLDQNTLVEHWNGSAWSIVSSPIPRGSFGTQLTGVSCPTSTSCTAVGFNDGAETETALIEHWNGKAWSVVPSPALKGVEVGVLSAVSCPSAVNCTAVGVQFGLSAAKVLIEHWSGKAWSIVPSPSPSGAEIAELLGVSCPTSTSCTAVGISEAFEGTRSPGAKTLVERWDGTAWSVSPSPTPAAPFASLGAVSCASATSCDAVGMDSASLVATSKAFAEHWDGTAWKIVTVATPKGAKTTLLSSVSCRSANSCDAVGLATNASGTKTLVEHWTGARWQIVSSANPSGAVSASLAGVSCPNASTCLAVGSYNSSDSFFTLAERGS